MLHGITMGRRARRGAKVDAQRRGPNWGCKTVVQKRGAKRGFAMEELQGRDATRNCNRKGCEEGCNVDA